MTKVSTAFFAVRVFFVVAVGSTYTITTVPPARAQVANASYDPRPLLATLIQAFQRCGPPSAYGLLGSTLFQAIYLQTGGQGCYASLAAYGPVLNMSILNTVQYPAGPIFTIKTDHSTGSLYWQIGISMWTQRVEYLNVNGSQQQPQPPPNPEPKPKERDDPKPGTRIVSNDAPRPVDPDQACLVYKGMCPKEK